MILQLSQPLHFETSKGPGIAQLVIDYGPEVDLLWVIALDQNGEMWCLNNREVRLSSNITFNRKDVKF